LSFKAHRFCAIDAGSTNQYACEKLRERKLVIPDPATGLASLTVITNCPSIATHLQDPELPVGLVMLGGRLRKSTVAFAGELTERCWASMGLHPDIAFVGTTSLRSRERSIGGETDYELMGFYSDSEEESRTKSTILHQSMLKVVLMDASKCDKDRTSAFIFAPVSREHVDLVITAVPIKEEKNKNFENCVRAMWRAGVAVLVLDCPDRSR